MRLLVVEDEQDLAEAIALGLRREGYAVDVAFDGEEALVKAAVYPYDLVCLDLNLPRVDGREVCRRLRTTERYDEEPSPRVLMLTARDALADRVAGLDDGADDYLVKPFDFAELTARVRALLRRDAARSGALLEVGEITLDTAKLEAHRAGRDLDLTAKEFQLLRYFMSRPGEVISEGDLLTHVWDENANPYTKTVRVTIATLRRKLALPNEEQPIETVIGAGYRLRALP
ncbi:MAG TPA: response regulator transcription factor [Gaiellaceae bacterium]